MNEHSPRKSTMAKTIVIMMISMAVILRCSASAAISKPGCPDKCGNISIPYPFGIGAECAVNSGFQLKCNDSFTPNRTTFKNDEFQIYNISDSQLRMSSLLAFNCYNRSGISQEIWASTDLVKSPFSFADGNMFTLVGCDDYARIYGASTDRSYSFGCMSICSQVDDARKGECSGLGCCQVPVPKGLRSYNITLGSFGNHTDVIDSNWCGFGFLGGQDSFRFGGVSDLKNPVDFWNTTRNSLPIVLDWAIGNLNCSEAHKRDDFTCTGNTTCVDTEVGSRGYRCECNQGYEGNPYLEPGCQDIDECMDANKNDCEMKCNNTLGGYNCWCPRGYYGDGIRGKKGCIPLPSRSNSIKIILGTTIPAGSLLLLFIALTWTYLAIRKRKLTSLKNKFFEQNGGILLKEQISKAQHGVETATRVFRIEELEKATMNYAKENILGQGGYGTVYRGVLSDKRVVAIKKSKTVDASQIEQFINEVMILTQVKHRNVVKLFGCCLETEVPQLVYEFIGNGTLYQHIHGRGSWLSWDHRLRIAFESASALSYLHYSAASEPIIHRDVKSANILIDENLTAKISDFGASRSVPIDQTHVATLVQGTLGYLDPEYFHSGKLTEKSDVYSFGVVLAELLTGHMPLLCMEESNEKISLASYFLTCVKENRLLQIVEPKIVREGTFDQIQAVGGIVVQCLDLRGENRPTMTQVAAELAELMSHKRHHPWTETPNGNNEENLKLMVGTESSCDLYSNSIASSGISPEFSGQYSSDTAILLFHSNNPR